MKFEIVDFYPLEVPIKKLYGTIHVYLIEPKIDFRGIQVLKMEKGMFFKLPGIAVTDMETKKPVFFPFIDFTDIDFKKELIGFLRKEGKDFIKKNYREVYGQIKSGKKEPITQTPRYLHKRIETQRTKDPDSTIRSLNELLRRHSDKKLDQEKN